MTPGRRPSPSGDDRGTGVFGSLVGLLVAILFLAFAAQVLLGLYATSTLRATVYDAAARAASQDGGGRTRLASLADQAERSLGAMGDRTEIRLRLVDDDGDGEADVVAGDGVAEPPRVVPRSLGGMVGFEEIRAGVRVRIERPR